MPEILLGDIKVDVILKDIKNIHLSVYPPNGSVRVSAPSRMSLENIRVYAISKLNWIKKHRNRFQNQDRETPRDYISKEGHYYFGKRYLLKIIHHEKPPTVEIKHDRLVIFINHSHNIEKRKLILEAWYRKELKVIIPNLIEYWEKIIGVKVNEFGIKKMKTKWGTCNIKARRIWLNLELAKKPLHCLEYIIVHEMVHLLERNHNSKFIAHLDKFLPQWRSYKEELNRFPISHTQWKY